jgi:hypothetical protein
MVLPINRPWAHLASSRCAGPRQGETSDLAHQTDTHCCVESTWIPLDRYSLKRDEIRWELLCYADPRVTSRMEETSSPWSHSKVDRPYGQCSLLSGKLVKNSLVTAEMRKAPHPPYSPDLAPSNFCLIGYVMQIMAGQSFSNAEELLSAFWAIFGGIEKSTLITICREWMEWFAEYVDTGGEYTKWSTRNTETLSSLKR